MAQLAAEVFAEVPDRSFQARPHAHMLGFADLSAPAILQDRQTREHKGQQ
jgi:hypothetical protein